MAVTTPNLWALIQSHYIVAYFQRYINHDMNALEYLFFYNHNYDNHRERYIIRINDYSLEPTGFILHFNIIDSTTGRHVFPMNSLHITIHSIPGGPSQSHIVTREHPRTQINLSFSSYNPPYSAITCRTIVPLEIYNFMQTNGVPRESYELTNGVLRESYDDFYNIFERVLPVGIQNIINAVKDNIGGALSGELLMRSQSVQQKYINYKEKYLKYKQKYLELKNELTNKKIDI
jgi:hypothetical protein